MKINLTWPLILLIIAGVLVTSSYVYGVIVKNSVHMVETDSYLTPLPSKFDKDIIADLKHRKKYLVITYQEFIDKIQKIQEQTDSTNYSQN